MAYEEVFQQVAAKYGLDWQLLAAQSWHESAFDPKKVGEAGELGLMQITPVIWEEWSTKVGATDPDVPEENVRVAGAYLAWLSDRLVAAGRGEACWMLAAYSWGANNVLRLLQVHAGWDQVPSQHQDYANAIILCAEANAVSRAIAPSASPIYA